MEKEGARWHARVEAGKVKLVIDIMASGHRLLKRRMVQKEMYLNTLNRCIMRLPGHTSVQTEQQHNIDKL